MRRLAAVRQNILYGGGQLAFAKAQLGADTAFLARTGQTFPYTVALIRQQNQLNRITGVLADAQQTSRNDAGIVENQRVSGTPSTPAGCKNVGAQWHRCPCSVPACEKYLACRAASVQSDVSGKS